MYVLSYLLILLFCTIDHLLTSWELNTGFVRELNPLMADLMGLPVSTSLMLRLLWILTALLGLHYLSRFKPILIKKCLRFLVVVYGMVIIYHGIVIYRIIQNSSCVGLQGWLN